MVYSLVVLTTLFTLASAVFIGLVANDYLHIPARVKVEVRHNEKNRRS